MSTSRRIAGRLLVMCEGLLSYTERALGVAASPSPFQHERRRPQTISEGARYRDLNDRN